MEISYNDIFYELGQLYIENTQLKKQNAGLAAANSQLQTALQQYSKPAVINEALTEQTAQA